jgi:hypothetical protein
MMDPHLQAAISGAIAADIMPPSGQTVLYRARLRPGQAGATLCPCYDPVGHRATDPADPRCFGTGVLGGYAPAITIPLSIYPGAASQTQETTPGYLETQSIDVAYVSVGGPTLRRDDLLIVSPDPLGVPNNPDRRYTVGDEINPLHVQGIIMVRRYHVMPVELGAIVYRVPPPNTALPPDSTEGTL